MVPFLNFMSIIAERAGGVHIRVGGNTQETAYMVDSLPDGKILEKDKEDATNPVVMTTKVSWDEALSPVEKDAATTSGATAFSGSFVRGAEDPRETFQMA